MKRSRVCIIKSTLTSLLFRALITKHRTVELLTIPVPTNGFCFAGNNTEYFQSVDIHDNALMQCPIFKKVLEKDGSFEIVYWSNCTSSCDYQNLRWAWMAGVNRTGTSKVGRKDINITKDGAVEIQNVQPSDAGKYRCTVKRINHTSPEVHFITLSVNINGTNCFVVFVVVH